MGCIFVRNEDGEESKFDKSRVVAAAHNLTNRTKNASTHCEINEMIMFAKLLRRCKLHGALRIPHGC